ncbi:hypothetical protein MLD38_022507 [Melastoma candidum]|uniref:Uncharacterized protein n=1 Tax=Melastoma candidum TaxID=119954 RepID=A0ACB9QJC7_9MYRT|nr:hypothetical protein MLD38_022507 [Melastoma candidum]
MDVHAADTLSLTSSIRDLSFGNNSVSISFCSGSSGTVSGSDRSLSTGDSKVGGKVSGSMSRDDCQEEGSNVSREPSFRGCGGHVSKPHRGSDVRWEAIGGVLGGKDGDSELGLGDFRLLRKLGAGDIGSVYLAELRGTGCLFAVKVMDKGMLEGSKKSVRARTERDILGLLDHPFLPTLYSHFETDKFSCLLMEFCSGGDLHTLRQRQPQKHFSEHAARFYASEVLLALEYLHVLGVVYRDLKPENILVRDDGHIMMSDFDLSLRCSVNPVLVQGSSDMACRMSAYCIEPSCIDPKCELPVCVEPRCLQPSCFKPRFSNPKVPRVKMERIRLPASGSLPQLIAEPTNARSMSFVGTHEYLAPEIIRGDGHGSSVDWWTFGIFLYELLHGRTPFKGNGNRETLFNVVGQPLKFPEGSGVSFAAKDLIRGLLAKDPQKRLGFKRGAAEIKQHPFFESLNWALIRSILPPEIPKPVDPSFLKHAVKSSAPSNEKGTTAATDSDRSSGPYLDFEFF